MYRAANCDAEVVYVSASAPAKFPLRLGNAQRGSDLSHIPVGVRAWFGMTVGLPGNEGIDMISISAVNVGRVPEFVDLRGQSGIVPGRLPGGRSGLG